jgi:hypothetical protein
MWVKVVVMPVVVGCWGGRGLGRWYRKGFSSVQFSSPAQAIATLFGYTRSFAPSKQQAALDRQHESARSFGERWF